MKKIILDGKAIQGEFIHHAYQPLYFLSDWRIMGYEALLRSPCFETPEGIFKSAERSDKLYELDTLSLFKATTFYASINKASQTLLFVNVFPSTLLHPDFHHFLDEWIFCHGPLRGRVVLEINESQEIKDDVEMRNTLSVLRRKGFRIALDDVGKGPNSLKNLVEFEPDFIKLDKYFSSNLSVSTKKQELLELFVRYCKGITHLVLEGIEKPEDLSMAKLLGVSFGQGYLLGKPEIFNV